MALKDSNFNFFPKQDRNNPRKRSFPILKSSIFSTINGDKSFLTKSLKKELFN